MEFETEAKDQPMQDQGIYEKYVERVKELAKKPSVEKLMPKDINDAHSRIRPGGGASPSAEWQEAVDGLRDRLLIESKERRKALKGKQKAAAAPTPAPAQKRKIATHSPPKPKAPGPAAQKKQQQQQGPTVSQVERLQKENHKLRQICIALLMEEK